MRRRLLSGKLFLREGYTTGEDSAFRLNIASNRLSFCRIELDFDQGVSIGTGYHDNQQRGGSMLRSVKDMIGYPVKASDGRIGRVTDCLFEDVSWKMRHLVVDTGNHFHVNFRYLSGEDDYQARRREVLIEPEDMKTLGLGWMGRKLRVRLTKDKVEHSPGVASDASVSQQYEQEYTSYYRHTPYGVRPRVWDFVGSSSYQPPNSAYPHDPEEIEAHERRIKEIGKNHLRSAGELMGYHVEAADGLVGRIEDLIVHEGDWMARQLAVRIGGLMHRKSVLIRVNSVADIDWSDRTIRLDMFSDEVEASPEYRPHAPVNRDALSRYYDYYGKPIPELKVGGFSR